MWENIELKTAYCALVGTIVLVEHFFLFERLRGNEFARRAIGIATVVLSAVPFGLAEILDMDTIAWLTIAFAISGAIVGGGYAWRGEEQRRERLAILRGGLPPNDPNEESDTG